MNPSSGKLGSIAIGMGLDLRNLQRDANKAQGILTNLQKTTEKKSASSGGGLLSNLIGSSKEAGFSLSLLSNFQGPLGRVGTAVSGIGRAFGSMGKAAGAGAAGIGATVATAGVAIAVIAALAVVIGTVIVAFKGMQLAASEAQKALVAAGNQQALDTSFKVLASNLKLSSGQIAQFRGELEKMDYTTAEQTQIMQKLTNALGSNGLSKQALEATKAMRDLSVIAGVSSKEGVDVMTNAVGSLNTEVLKQFGVLGTSTQHFEAYGALIGKSADEMSNAERQHAILNAVIERGSQTMGAATAARDDFNRLQVRLRDNANQLRAALGQVFLPLASGIMSTLNSEVLGLSKSADENKQKFQSMGQTLANAVVPALQNFIAWLRQVPWDRVINGFLIGVQYARVFGAGVIMVAKQTYGAGQIMAGVFGIVGASIYQMLKPFQVVAKAASAFWRAIRGEISAGEAFSEIKSAGEAAAQGIKNTWGSAFKGLGAGFKTITDSAMDFSVTTANAMATIKNINFAKYWAGLPKGLSKANKEALSDFTDTAGDMGEEGAKAAKKLADQLAKENEDFARNQAKALESFKAQLEELVIQHRDQIASIRKDIEKETKNYTKAQQERTTAYEKQIAELDKADRDRKNDVNKQLAEELAKGSQADKTKLASLRSRLAYEDSAHKSAVAEVETNYEKETTAAKEQYNERISELQTSLDKELAIQKKHSADFTTYKDSVAKDDITKLKEQYVKQKAEDQRAHAERLADMIKQGAESAAQSKANGLASGAAGMDGMGAGITGGIPDVNAKSKEAGKQAGEAARQGLDSKKTSIKETLINVFKQAAAGAAVGSIFGPVGTLVGSIIGGKIGASGGTVGQALKNMWNKAIGVMGSLWEYGQTIMRKLGQAIRDALPGPVKGAFRSAWNSSGFPAFATGGIVNGKQGKDNVVARVSAGEMILNKNQQQRMFNLLDGKLGTSGNGNSSGNINIESLSVSLPAVRNATDFERELKLKFATMRSN